MGFVNYFYELAHKVFKRGQFGESTDIEKYVGAIGLNYDDAMESMFQLREQALIVTATGKALDAHGQDRGLPRYPGETDQAYRLRLINAYSIYQKLGTKAAILKALARMGYKDSDIEELYLTNPERWAEFIVKIQFGQDRPLLAVDSKIIRTTVKMMKPAHTLPGFEACTEPETLLFHTRPSSWLFSYPLTNRVWMKDRTGKLLPGSLKLRSRELSWLFSYPLTNRVYTTGPRGKILSGNLGLTTSARDWLLEYPLTNQVYSQGRDRGTMQKSTLQIQTVGRDYMFKYPLCGEITIGEVSA